MDFFEYAAAKTPVVVHEGNIYLAANSGAGEGALIMRNNGAETRYSLLKADSESIWLAYWNANRKSIAAFLKESGYNDPAFESAGYAAALSAVLLGAGPHFTRGDPLGGEEAYLAFLEEKLGVPEGGNRRTEETARLSKLPKPNFGAHLKKYPSITVIYKKHCFFPSENNSSPTATITLGDAYTCYDYDACGHGLGEAFRAFIMDYAAYEAAGSAAHAGGRKAAIVSAAMEKLEKGGIDFGSWGVTRDGKAVVAYVRIPEYGLRDWHAERPEYYRIPESRIGVYAHFNGMVSDPVMLTHSISPFVRDGKAPFEICMPYEGSRMGAGREQGNSVIDRIVKGLNDAKRVLMHGFTRSHADYNTPNRLGKYPECKIKKPELIAMGIPITNE